MEVLPQSDQMTRITALRLATLVLENHKNSAARTKSMAWWHDCAQAIVIINEMIGEERERVRKEIEDEMVRRR